MPDAPRRPAVVADGVSKTFRIPKEQVHTLKERALHPFRRNVYNEFRALDEVSFQVPPDEFFGIVGRNGSGKSTLLKCLAGIYRADSGSIYVDGRMSTFIELGVGFNPDLAALDNVTINAAMLGLSRREARRRFDAIIDFAELREFSDLKIKNYSSGMLVRLAFSVMIQVDADILLIDEVLAVGDAAFQQKCFDEFEAIRAGGRTVLLVTHDMSAVRRFCDRAMLLEHGHLVAMGDPDVVGNRYLDLNFSASARARAEAEAAGDSGPEVELAASGEVFGDGRAVIEECWVENAAGERAEILAAGERLTLAMRVRFVEAVTDPRFAAMLRNGARVTVFAPSSGWEDPHPGTFAAGEEVLWRATFDNVLAADRYTLTPTVTLGGGATLAVHEQARSFVVTRAEASGGVVDLPFEQQSERPGPVDVRQEIVR
jgi:ABC-type polysaccharide/polyol phosphate transport system ATPase subunit